MTSLPPELMNGIISCLLEPEPQAEERWANGDGADPTNCINTTGAALCLASLAFLPFGRRVLYERIELRNGGGHDRVRHIQRLPHLTVFLRACVLELIDDLDEHSLLDLLDLIAVCPNFDSFELLARAYPAPNGRNHQVVSNVANVYIEVCRSVAIAGLPSSLRHLAVATSGVAWNPTVELLGRSASLKTLFIDGNGYRPRRNDIDGEEEDPVLRTTFNMPSLVDLSASICCDELIEALLSGAPNLANLTWLTQTTSFPTLAMPHRRLASLSIQVRLPATAADADAYLLALSTFIASFSSLQHLWILLVQDRTIRPFAPSSAGSATFLSSLPPSLISLSLCGHLLLSTSLAMTPLLLLPSTPFPSLKLCSPLWGKPSNSHLLFELRDACTAVGVDVGGDLRDIHESWWDEAFDDGGIFGRRY